MVVEQHPGGHPQQAPQMGHRGVVGDQQVHAEQQRSGLVKGVGWRINTALGGKEAIGQAGAPDLLCGRTHLHRDQIAVLQGRDPLELSEAKGPPPQGEGLDRIAAGGALPVEGQQRGRARRLGQLLAPGRLPQQPKRPAPLRSWPRHPEEMGQADQVSPGIQRSPLRWLGIDRIKEVQRTHQTHQGGIADQGHALNLLAERRNKTETEEQIPETAIGIQQHVTTLAQLLGRQFRPGPGRFDGQACGVAGFIEGPPRRVVPGKQVNNPADVVKTGALFPGEGSARQLETLQAIEPMPGHRQLHTKGGQSPER